LNTAVYIQSYSEIRNGAVWLNGEKIFSAEEEHFPDFAKKAYQHFGLAYPKFFKMDKLSKLAFLASGPLLTEESNTALVFANRSSSLDTDLIYQRSIEDKEAYYPSPAVFVYTLPNICLGEISIKYKLYSENSFFVFENFPAAFFPVYADALMKTGKADNVLCGWVEMLEEDYRAFVYRIGNEGLMEHTEQNLNKLI